LAKSPIALNTISESVASILLRHADAMQIDPFCMTHPTVCHLLRWILRFGAPDGIRIPAPNRSTDFDPALPLMSAANAAKAGYNSLILLSGAPEGIRTLDPQPWLTQQMSPAQLCMCV
jgi:hypothetical protein